MHDLCRVQSRIRNDIYLTLHRPGPISCTVSSQKRNIFDVTTCRIYLIRVHGLPPPTFCIVSYQKRCAGHTPTNSGVNYRSKDVTQTQQKRLASPTVTFASHANTRCINSTEGSPVLSPLPIVTHVCRCFVS